jgi:hypothetical protein
MRRNWRRSAGKKELDRGAVRKDTFGHGNPTREVLLALLLCSDSARLCLVLANSQVLGERPLELTIEPEG